MLISRTPLEVPLEMIGIMLLTNKFNMEGRYPEYIQDIESIGNKAFSEEQLKQVKLLITWLIKTLQ